MSSSAPEQATPPFPTFGTAVKLILILIGIGIGMTVPLAVLMVVIFKILKVRHEADLTPFLLNFPVQAGSFSITILIAKRWSKRPWKELLALRSVTNQVWAPLLIAVPALISVSIAAHALVNRLLPEPAWFGQMIGSFGFISIVVGAPLTEEPFFRGVILGGFLDRYSRWRAILFSAILFALYHLNPWQLLPALMIGIFAGWIFAETRSIWPVVTLHLLNNGVAYAAVKLQMPFPKGTQDNLLPFWMHGLGLILLSIGVLWMSRVFRSQSKGFARLQGARMRINDLAMADPGREKDAGELFPLAMSPDEYAIAERKREIAEDF